MTTVNRPTNVKQKEEDVNQKLQLYGIYSGKHTMPDFNLLRSQCTCYERALLAIPRPGLILHFNSVCEWQSTFGESSKPKLSLLGYLSDNAQNKQIDVALSSAVKTKPLASPSPKLSPEGQKLVGHLREVIEQAKILVLTKNQGNLLQDFIWQTEHLGGGNAQRPGAPVDKDTAKQHGNQALDGLRTLGTLLISNGQFRKLCKFL